MIFPNVMLNLLCHVIKVMNTTEITNDSKILEYLFSIPTSGINKI